MHLQARIERCRTDALDTIRDDVKPGSKIDDAVIEKKFVAALVPCLDRTLASLPMVLERVKVALK